MTLSVMTVLPGNRSQEKCEYWYGGLESRGVGSVRVPEAGEEEERVPIQPAYINNTDIQYKLNQGQRISITNGRICTDSSL